MKKILLLLNLVGVVQLFGKTTPSVTADFSATLPEITIGTSVQFTDRSIAQNTTVTAWSWSFSGGNPATSTAKNPMVQYATPGVYTVTLTVSNGSGVRATKTKTGYISVYPAPQLERTSTTGNFFTDKQDLLTARWTSPPTGVYTKTLTRGPVLGNGDASVVGAGTTTTQTLLINKSDFITDNSQLFGPTVPDPVQLPLGGVNIIVNSPATSGYLLEQDIVAAELRMKTATNPQVNIRNWVATGKNLVVSELTNSSTTPVLITVETFANANDTTSYPAISGINGILAYAVRTTRSNNLTRWTSKAGLTTRILGANAKVSKGAYKSLSTFTLTRGQTINVLTYVSGGGQTNDAKLSEAATYLNGVTSADVVALDATNKQWWKDFYNKSYVETYDAAVNRYYIAALYELGCTFRATSPVCAGLYGNWITQDNPEWHSDIHLNYNGQAPFYGVFSGNRPEMALPFFKAIEDYIPEGQRRAQQEMGRVRGGLTSKRGILYPLGIGNWGKTTDDVYLSQVVAAPFNVPLFEWYYEHTMDEAFLRNRAYPYAKLVGDFLEDYVVKETGNYKDGYRYTITAGAHEGTWNKNSISDLAFTRRLFTSLLTISRKLGVDTNRRAVWKDILDHLSAYPTTIYNGKRIFAFDDAGWVRQDNNATILFLVHPAETVHLLSPKDSLEIAKSTLRAYTVNSTGPGWENINNFPMAFPMGARIGFDADTLWNAFRGYINGNTGPNFLINDNVHGMEKAGSIETIHSMMLQSVNNTLLFFPNWMAAKPGYFRNLRTQGAFVVSADYLNGKTSNITIYSEKGSLCKVRSPWLGKQMLVYRKGIAIIPTVTGDIYSFPTKAGATYTLAEGTVLHK